MLADMRGLRSAGDAGGGSLRLLRTGPCGVRARAAPDPSAPAHAGAARAVRRSSTSRASRRLPARHCLRRSPPRWHRPHPGRRPARRPRGHRPVNRRIRGSGNKPVNRRIRGGNTPATLRLLGSGKVGAVPPGVVTGAGPGPRTWPSTADPSRRPRARSGRRAGSRERWVPESSSCPGRRARRSVRWAPASRAQRPRWRQRRPHGQGIRGRPSPRRIPTRPRWRSRSRRSRATPPRHRRRSTTS